jgi:hypothetical protein
VPLIRDMRGFVSYFILVPSEREEWNYLGFVDG